MRRFGVSFVLALGALLVLAFGASAASTQDLARVDKVGWWSKRPAAQPTAGANSFEIASGVDGNESVAAFRILIAGTITKATLVITEASNPLTFTPKLEACPTDTPWVVPTSPGAYADAPTPSCDKAAVPLTRNATGTWTGDVTALLSGPKSELSLMVLPAPDNSLPIPPTFFLTFAAPRIDAEGTADVPTTTTPPVTSPKAVAPIASPPSGGVRPSAPSPVTASPAPPPTAAPPTTAVATPATAPARFAPPVIHHPPKPWGKLVWIVPLAALLATGYTFGRKAVEERTSVTAAPA